MRHTGNVGIFGSGQRKEILPNVVGHSKDCLGAIGRQVHGFHLLNVAALRPTSAPIQRLRHPVDVRSPRTTVRSEKRSQRGWPVGPRSLGRGDGDVPGSNPNVS